MSSLNEILKTMRWAKDLKSSFGITSSVPEIPKTQDILNNGLSTTNNLVKIINQQNQFYNPTIENIFGNSFPHKNSFPTNTITSITAIDKNIRKLIGLDNIFQLSNNSLFLNNTYKLVQNSNLNYALKNSFLQLIKEASFKERWGLIEEVEDITDEVVSVSEKFIDNKGITREDFEGIKTSLNVITEKLNKSNTDTNSLFWKYILPILAFLLGIIGEARNWMPKPEYATKQELEELYDEQKSFFEKKLNEINQHRTTKRESKVLKRPKRKSFVVTVLPIGYDLSVILNRHKWAFVTYNKDNSLKSGWVLKKYLKKTK